jgi:hypothetical protein
MWLRVLLGEFLQIQSDEGVREGGMKRELTSIWS